jgi:Rrf2 family nitric oxide-sensitive transcriptional repressor
MRLTMYSEYSLRVLIYLACVGDERATIGTIAKAYGISRQHLTKIVHNLARLGYVRTVRGKGGGLELAKPLESIGLGELVRKTEADLKLVDCDGSACPIRQVCLLRSALGAACNAFLATLDRYTLASLVTNKSELIGLLR